MNAKNAHADATAAASSPYDVAPRWHTYALVTLILGVALIGTLATSPAPVPSSAADGTTRLVAMYLPVVVVQLALAGYVCRVGRPRNMFTSLLGKRWNDTQRAATDVTLAFLIVAGAIALSHVEFTRWAVARGGVASELLPTNMTERTAWLFVAVIVGVCEETVYRGYLQTQLGAFTRSAAAGVALQAILFAVAHGEQGPRGALLAGFYGLVFGVVARARSSLIAGMLAHVAIDMAASWR